MRELDPEPGELKSIFSDAAKWGNDEHVRTLVAEATADIDAKAGDDLILLCSKLGIPIPPDDEQNADALRTHLHTHLETVSGQLQRIGRGEKAGLWMEGHTVGLLGGLPGWWRDPPSEASDRGKREGEALERLLAEAADGKSSALADAERAQLLSDLGSLDEASRTELQQIVRDLEALRTSRAALERERAEAEASAERPSDAALSELSEQVRSVRDEVQALRDRAAAALSEAGVDAELSKLRAAQEAAADVVVPCSGVLDADLEADSQGRAAVVKSLRGEGGPLQRDGRVQPGMVLVRVSGVDVSAMPHAEVARLLEDTSAEGFRSLRFRSAARHQTLAEEAAKRVGTLALRVESWKPLDGGQGAFVRVTVTKATNMPPVEPAAETAAFSVRLVCSGADATLHLPATCAGAAEAALEGEQAPTADLPARAGDVGEVWYAMADRNGAWFLGSGARLAWEAEGEGTSAREEEVDGRKFAVVAADSNASFYPVQPPSVARPAEGEGAGAGAGAEGGERSVYEGVAWHREFPRDDAERFAPGEEDELTHMRRVSAMLRFKCGDEAKQAEAALAVRAKAAEARMAEVEAELQGLHAQIEEVKANAAKANESLQKETNEAKSKLQDAQAALNEEYATLEELNKKRRAVERQKEALSYQMQEAMEDLNRVNRAVMRLEAALAKTSDLAQEEYCDFKKVTPGSFIRFFEYRTHANV